MKKIFFAVFALLLMVGFQNCSKVGFDAMEKLDTSAGIVDPIDNGSTPNDDLPNDNANNDNDNSNNDNDNTDYTDNDQDNSQDDVDDDQDGSAGDEESNPVVDCEKLQSKNLLYLISGSSIQNNISSIRAKSERIIAIRNNIGSLKILGIGDDAKIDLIENSVGSILICNMDVDTLGKTVGSVTIVGGSINELSGKHVGSIKVYNGSIAEVKNNIGSILVVNGTIGNVTNQVGSIRLKNATLVGTVTNHIGTIRVLP